MTYDEFSELWWDIPGWEGYYQINLNREIKRLGRFVANKWGRKSWIKERLLSPYRHKTGYMYVVFCVGNKQQDEKVHRLMGRTFIPNPLNKPHINHIDHDPGNNNIENLEWVTPTENMQHSAKAGRKVGLKGSANPMFNRRGKDHHCFGMRGSANYGAKMVLDTETGIYYGCAQEALEAKGFKMSLAVLRHKLNGALKNTTSLIYA